MSELLRLNHIFKYLLPCGRGCAAAVELVRTSCYNNNKYQLAPLRGTATAVIAVEDAATA